MSFAYESAATQLRRDDAEERRKESMMRLESMYNVFMNEDSLAKYEDQHRQLAHVNKNARDLRGHMYFYKHELVCFVSIEKIGDKNWIDTLEVCKPYRGKMLSVQLLDVAVKKFHATDLKVHSDNKRAIAIFEKYGFRKYDKKGNYIYMTIDSSTKKKETEMVPLTKKDKESTKKLKEANECAYMLYSEALEGVIPTQFGDGERVHFFPSVKMALAYEGIDLTGQDYYVMRTSSIPNANYEMAEECVEVEVVDHIRVGLGRVSADPELRKYNKFDWGYLSLNDIDH